MAGEWDVVAEGSTPAPRRPALGEWDVVAEGAAPVLPAPPGRQVGVAEAAGRGWGRGANIGVRSLGDIAFGLPAVGLDLLASAGADALGLDYNNQIFRGYQENWRDPLTRYSEFYKPEPGAKVEGAAQVADVLGSLAGELAPGLLLGRFAVPTPGTPVAGSGIPTGAQALTAHAAPGVVAVQPMGIAHAQDVTQRNLDAGASPEQAMTAGAVDSALMSAIGALPVSAEANILGGGVGKAATGAAIRGGTGAGMGLASMFLQNDAVNALSAPKAQHTMTPEEMLTAGGLGGTLAMLLGPRAGAMSAPRAAVTTQTVKAAGKEQAGLQREKAENRRRDEVRAAEINQARIAQEIFADNQAAFEAQGIMSPVDPRFPAMAAMLDKSRERRLSTPLDPEVAAGEKNPRQDPRVGAQAPEPLPSVINLGRVFDQQEPPSRPRTEEEVAADARDRAARTADALTGEAPAVVGRPDDPGTQAGIGRANIEAARTDQAAREAGNAAEARRERKDTDVGIRGNEPSPSYQPGDVQAVREGATTPETFTFVGRVNKQTGQIDGEAAEVLGPGEGKDTVRVRLTDRPGQPEVEVSAKDVIEVSRPQNPRYAQDLAARSYEPPRGVGKDSNPAPRDATERVGGPRVEYIPANRTPPPRETRAGDVFEGTAEPVREPLGLPRLPPEAGPGQLPPPSAGDVFSVNAEGEARRTTQGEDWQTQQGRDELAGLGSLTAGVRRAIDQGPPGVRPPAPEQPIQHRIYDPMLTAGESAQVKGEAGWVYRVVDQAEVRDIIDSGVVRSRPNVDNKKGNAKYWTRGVGNNGKVLPLTSSGEKTWIRVREGDANGSIPAGKVEVLREGKFSPATRAADAKPPAQQPRADHPERTHAPDVLHHRGYERLVADKAIADAKARAARAGMSITDDQARIMAGADEAPPARERSGAWPKEARPVMADEAQSFVDRTGRSATYTSFDVSNMAGLNSKGGTASVDDVVLAKIVEIVSKHFGEAAGAERFEIIKHGGDEFDVIAFGASKEAADNAMRKAIAEIEEEINWGVQSAEGVPVALIVNPKAKKFTADMDPANVTGTSIYHATGEFKSSQSSKSVLDSTDTLVDVEKARRRGDVTDADAENVILKFTPIPADQRVPVGQRAALRRAAAERIGRGPGAEGPGNRPGGEGGEPVTGPNQPANPPDGRGGAENTLTEADLRLPDTAPEPDAAARAQEIGSRLADIDEELASLRADIAGAEKLQADRQKKAAQAKNSDRKARGSAREGDTLLDALGRYGAWKKADAEREGLDPADMNRASMERVGRAPFSSKGERTGDELVALLREDGYDVKDVSDLLTKLQEEMSGQRFHTRVGDTFATETKAIDDHIAWMEKSAEDLSAERERLMSERHGENKPAGTEEPLLRTYDEADLRARDEGPTPEAAAAERERQAKIDAEAKKQVADKQRDGFELRGQTQPRNQRPPQQTDVESVMGNADAISRVLDEKTTPEIRDIARRLGIDGWNTRHGDELVVEMKDRFTADQVRRAATGPRGPRGQQGFIHPNLLLAPLARAIRKAIFGHESNAQIKAQRDQFLQSIKDAVQGFTPSGRLSRSSIPRDIFRHVLASSHGDLQMLVSKFKSPTAQKLVDDLFPTAGRESAGHAFDEDAASQAARRLATAQKTIFSVLEKNGLLADQAAYRRIVDLVENPGRARAGVEGQIATAVEKYLKEMHDYLKQAGVDIGEVRGYFPRQFEVGKVANEPVLFRQKAAEAYRLMGSSAADADIQANALWESVVYGDSGVPGGKAPSGSSAPSFVKSRKFSPQAAAILDQAGFYSKDLGVAITSYTQRAVKRAEIARRWGDNWSNWEALERQMIAEDPGLAQVMGEIRDLTAAMTGVQRTGISQGMQQWMSMLRTATTLGTLEKSALASLGELLMAPLRASKGDALADTAQTFRNLQLHVANTMRKVVGAGESAEMQAARDLAEDIGAIAGEGMAHLQAARFAGGDPIGSMQAQALSRFFMRTRLSQLTDYTRVTSVLNGQIFMRRLAKDLIAAGGKGKNAFYLRELGVPKGQEEAFAKWLNSQLSGGSYRPADMSGAFGDMYRNALVRFTDQTVMRPSNATRPAWASSPLGSVIFQLQSFGYAFQKNVINRQARIGARMALDTVRGGEFNGGDMAAATLGLALNSMAVVAMQYLVGEGRDEVFPPRDNRTMTERAKLERAASRSGFVGAADPYIQAVSGTRYDRPIMASLTGPALGGVSTAGNAFSASAADSSDSNTKERAAARAFYNWIMEPAIQFAMTPLPVSAASTAVTSYAVPAMQEPFVDWVAGARNRPARNADKPIRGLTEGKEPLTIEQEIKAMRKERQAEIKRMRQEVGLD